MSKDQISLKVKNAIDKFRSELLPLESALKEDFNVDLNNLQKALSQIRSQVDTHNSTENYIDSDPEIELSAELNEELIDETSKNAIIQNGEDAIVQKEDFSEDDSESILNGKAEIPLEITNSGLGDEQNFSSNNSSNIEAQEATELESLDVFNKDLVDTNDLTPTLENMAKLEPGKKKVMDSRKEFLYVAANAMVGKNYEIRLSEISNLNLDGLVDILELSDSNLSIDIDEFIVYGTPQVDGEYSFPLVYENIDEEKEIHALRILVNPDPRSLWKNLEPSKDELYPKEHFDFEIDRFGTSMIVAASQRGRSHAHSGTFRDDDFALKKISDKIYFIAVADGAGSSKYSREGSKIACEKAAETIEQHIQESKEDWTVLAQELDDDRKNREKLDELTGAVYLGMSSAVMNARNGLINKSEEEDHELKDYSTTLLFSIIIKLKTSYFIASYSIGDGIIAHVSDSVKLLSIPDGGQYAGQTRFLTMPEAIEDLANRLKITFVDELTGLYLMTDGISDPFFETDANMSEYDYWEQLSKSIHKEVDFENGNIENQLREWINFWSPGNHDDRTIVFINKNTAV